MIINANQYNGVCACGSSHKMDTEFCVIESGCLKRFPDFLQEHGLQGYTTTVYDENTYQATADRHPQADTEIILPAAGLHADEHGVALLLSQLPRETTYLIAVGSGTIHDLTRYCAHERGIDFISCPTAATVDGFCSSVAAMTWNGFKKTFTAIAPKLVIADLDVIRQAPIRLARAGFGDMIGKYISLTDWKISSILTGEFYCDTIAGLTRQATEQVLSSADGIASGSERAYENLMYGLLLSGLAMQMMGNSRPASGAEHHISHLIEMRPQALSLDSHALHGEKVGVGTLLAVREYRNLRKKSPADFRAYTPFSDAAILNLFGSELADDILRENRNDPAGGLTAKHLQDHWSEICTEIDKLPALPELEEIYRNLGVKATLREIDVPDHLEHILLSNSPMVRNRLTLMRIRNCII